MTAAPKRDVTEFAQTVSAGWPKTIGVERGTVLLRTAQAAADAGFQPHEVEYATNYVNETKNQPPLTPGHAWLVTRDVFNGKRLDAPIEPGEPGSITLESPTTIDPVGILKTDYLVKGWLDRGTLAQVFGQWGSGKTFALLHMGVHIAAGEPWFGNRVRQGGVLYIGYEGARSMAKRVEALKRELPHLAWDSMPFRWVSFRWPLVRKGGLSGATGHEKLAQTLHDFQLDTGHGPALLIIDPLRDALGGSDSDVELTGPYMTLVRQICHTTGATVLTVHHPGHGDKARGRGDSGIPGGLDTDIQITAKNGRGEITATKQRDQIKGRMYYSLKVVELGRDSDGDVVTSCIVEQTKAPIECSLTENQSKAWAAIVGDTPVRSMSEDEARKRCKGAGLPSNKVSRLLSALHEKKLIVWDQNAATITIDEIFPADESED